MQETSRKIWLNIDGREVSFEDENKVRVETTVTETCDNPKCPGRHGDDGPTSNTWVMEKSQTDPYAIPEDMWRFARVHRFGEREPKSYCSRQCEKEGRRDEKPLVSPHEQRRIDAACAAVNARISAEGQTVCDPTEDDGA